MSDDEFAIEFEDLDSKGSDDDGWNNIDSNVDADLNAPCAILGDDDNEDDDVKIEMIEGEIGLLSEVEVELDEMKDDNASSLELLEIKEIHVSDTDSRVLALKSFPRRRRSRSKMKSSLTSFVPAITSEVISGNLGKGDRSLSLDDLLSGVLTGDILDLNLFNRGLSDGDAIDFLHKLKETYTVSQEAQETRDFSNGACTGAQQIHLRSIILTRNSLSDDFACEIARLFTIKDTDSSISWIRKIRRLDLNQNNIGENGAREILGALRSNRSVIRIERLDLSWNGDITTETKLEIANELIVNIVNSAKSKLHREPATLYLHGQALGCDGVERICSYLKGDVWIRQVYLGDNDVRTRGAKALLTLLESNYTITHVDLEENYDLDPVLKEEIGTYLVRNRSIDGLYLNRYIVQEGYVHRSRTSEVVFAKDVKTVPASFVALKRMYDLDQFKHELGARFNLAQSSDHLEGCAVTILGFHIPGIDARVVVSSLSSSGMMALASANLGLESCGGGNGDALMSLLRQEESPEYVLVMPRASRSLWGTLGSERIAKYNIPKSIEIMKQILLKLQMFHNSGLVHCDLKPRNILFFDDSSLILCDLDSTVPAGKDMGVDMRSSAYSPPEKLKSRLLQEPLIAHTSYDVWSIGVILFEIFTGRHLFPQDLSNDDLVVDDKDGLNKLFVWSCIDDSLLDLILPSDDQDSGILNNKIDQQQQKYQQQHQLVTRRKQVQHLIRWCLRGDPNERPSVNDLLSHVLFGGRQGVPTDSQITLPTSEIVTSRNSNRMTFHVFISHFQAEGSGDVGTLYFLFKKMGLNVWRDMNVKNLTEASMRQGVFDSDVFILFLNNSTLSRYFCLKEIGWAIMFNKPIIIVSEEDNRFWDFSWSRFTTNTCTRNHTSSGASWSVGWLQNTYESVKQNNSAVHDLVKMNFEQNLVLPFRRREFEINALVTEIVKIASSKPSNHINWCLPPVTLESSVISLKRNVFILADPHLESSLTASVCSLFRPYGPALNRASDLSSCTHVLVLLTKDVIDICNQILSKLIDLITVQQSNPSQSHASGGPPLSVVFVYSKAHGWDFGEFYGRPHCIIKQFVASNEALEYRSKHQYEGEALMMEILRRMD